MAGNDSNHEPITMKDVAERAGVAVSSASRVLSGHPDVSASTRRRWKLQQLSSSTSLIS